LRKKHDFSQEKLAELAGVDYKHMQKIEGKNPGYARLNTIEKIAKAFNMSSSQLLKF
jgi:transcriptional regulator with XRE-family HTH domain